MRNFRIFLAVVSVVFLVSCTTVTKIDPTAFQVDTWAMMEIPPICKSTYQAVAVTRVGIVDFTNNSYGKVTVNSGWFWWRDVEMNLPQTVTDSVTDVVVNMGGAKVFTRTEMNKVLQEQKFQMSGLVDDKTLISFGKLAGLQYIITGAINNINFGANLTMGLTKAFLGVGGSSPEARMDLNIRMIDVTTGEIVFSKKVSGRDLLSNASYVGMIASIKNAAGKALEDIRPELSKRFVVKGYIFQTRTSADGKERSALINIGEKQGIKAGSKLVIYIFQDIKDPFSGKSTCDRVKLSVEAEVTDQIQDDKAWIIITGDPNQVRRVRTGALVERVPVEGQQFYKKLGF